jgi:hypothetical protein
MKTISKQYISNNKDRSSYNTIFKHYYDSSEKKVSKKGDIYALLDISAEKSVNVERISKFVWDSIVDGYLYSSASTTNESLKDAIKKGVEKVRELIKHDKELEEIGVDVSFTIILVKEEGTYVGIFGESDIFVFKNGSILNISDILKEKQANTAGIVLKEEDVLMVSSKGLLKERHSILSRLKKKEEFKENLDRMGSRLKGTQTLLYFLRKEEEEKETQGKKHEDEEKVKKESREKKEKTKDKEETKGLKNGAEKLLGPIARVERIKKPKDQTTMQGLAKKEKFKERMVKVKSTWEKTWAKIQPTIQKVGLFIKSKWTSLKEGVLRNIGRKKWYKKIAARWSEVSVKKRKPSGVKGMRIDGYKEKSKRGKRFKLLAMFVVIAILLVVGINFTIRMREAREISDLAQEKFLAVEELVEKTENNFATDRESAETYLFQAEKALEEVPEGLNEKDEEKMKALEDRILEVGDALYKRVGVVEKDSRLSNFLDTRLAFGEGSEVVDMTIYKDSRQNEYLVVADLGRKTIYRVSLYDKSVKALPDNSGLVKEPQFVYVGNEGVYVYDKKEGVLKASFDEEGWFTAFTSLSGLSPGDIRSTDIATMTVWTEADNVYFLSRDRSAFLRSTVAYGDSYGLAYEYFAHEKMEIATDMVADLSIYIILPESPHILRYNYNFFEGKYVEAPLGVVGFDGNYGKLTKAFTGPDLTYPLYVFDSERRRFLQLQKPIEAGSDMRHPNQVSLLNQFIYRGEKDSVWNDVKNFVVQDNEESMYILDGSTIWKMVL